MLKLLSKSLFVSVLCGSLMLMDFSYKGIVLNTALAESVKTDKISDSDLMGTLTMTAVGTIASRLYKYKMTTDVMLAAAGGAAFLGGEVLAYFKLKEVMKGMEVQITRDKNGNINKEQIEALEKLKKSYEEAKKTAETKKTLQLAAAMAFAAAGVMAYMMAAGDLTALTTCQTGIGTALATLGGAVTAQCASLKAGTSTAALGAECSREVASCVPAITKYQQSIMKYEMARQATGPSGPALTSTTVEGKALQTELMSLTGSCAGVYSSGAQSAMSGTCSPLVPKNDIGTSGGATLTASAPGLKNLPPIFRKTFLDNQLNNEKISAIMKNNNKAEGYIEKALNMVFPKAQAELFSAMGIASSAAINYLLSTSATLGPTIDMYLLIPQKRAIVWGVLAGLTYMATSATDNVIKQIESNITKIDGILNNMYQMSKGATGTQLAKNPNAVQTTLKPNAGLDFNSNDYNEVDLSKEGNGSLPCYTGSDPKNCKSFNDGIKDTPSFANLNLESQKQLQSILSTANGFNGKSKISSATLKSANTMANSANAMRTALDNARKKSAESLKKAGSKFNIDDQTKKLSGDIESGVNKALKKSNSTAAGMMASLYGGKGAIGSGSASTAKDDKNKEIALIKSTPRGANVVNIGSAGSGAEEKMDLEPNSGTKKLSAEELANINAAEKAAAGKSIDDYEIKNDISQDGFSSIFELISNRYQQSGYPRLFKLKDVKEEEVAPVTK